MNPRTKRPNKIPQVSKFRFVFLDAISKNRSIIFDGVLTRRKGSPFSVVAVTKTVNWFRFNNIDSTYQCHQPSLKSPTSLDISLDDSNSIFGGMLGAGPTSKCTFGGIGGKFRGGLLGVNGSLRGSGGDLIATSPVFAW
jgi:hypothetical protein